MSRRAFLLLCSIAVLVIAVATAMVIAAQGRDRAVAVGGGPMFPDFAERTADVVQVAVTTPRYSVTLERRGDSWVALELGDYPARTAPVAEVLAALATMTTVDPKTDNPDWYDFIGVGAPGGDDPAPGLRVTARAADGSTLADGIFGHRSTSIGYTRVGGTFVRRADEAGAWLVEGQMNVPGFLSEWFDQIVHVTGGEIARVSITEGGRLMFDAAKVDFATGRYQLTYVDPAAGPPRSTTDDDSIRSMTQALASTSFDGARPRDSVTFGPDARIIRFTTEPGLVLTLVVGEADGTVWVAYTAEAPAGTPAADTARGITERTGNWVFRLPDYRIAGLTQPLSRLIIPPETPPPQPLGAGQAPGLVPAIPFR
ncbi:MAG: hypothetical protein IT534_10515 [Bauldia sp.]|nr:hypothetical protein [Bauldia sp.]